MSSSLSPSSSTASVFRTLTHHVFLSFRGADIRQNLLTHILGEFQRNGITPFIDNKMERGASLGPELLRVIKAARICIVIFSRNYAASCWCLNELVEIMKCKDKSNQKVMTIFHRLEPVDVRHQRGDFGKAFEETCVGKSEEVKQLWKKTLTNAANIHGDGLESDKWNSEADMIAAITKDVSRELQSTQSMDFYDYVALPAHIESIDSLLCLDTYEVRMIGIWGPSGIGKTTIARVLLNKLSPQFQLSARIGDIKRRHLRHHDLYEAKAKLQKELFTELLKHENIEIPHLQAAKERFHDKNVLVILDDVNELWQLQATTHCPQWFGHGSRIIITTQDRRVLEQHGIQDKDIYNVCYPSTKEALQIFCMYAFDRKNPHPGFEDLAKEVTKLTGNLPLALEVMGSHFKHMSKDVWEIELKIFKKSSLHKDIVNILKFSYEALTVEQKYLFSFIACIFNGYMIDRVEEIIGDEFRRRLRVLEEKSLMHTYDGKIGMHSLLVKFVKEEIEECTVLVDAQKICNALTSNTENLAIRGLNLDLSKIIHELNIDERAFERMPSLEYLLIRHENVARPKVHLPRGLKSLPYKLKLLRWDNFPMKSMPYKFYPNLLVELNMKDSKLKKLWKGNAALGSLKEINLRGSKNLKGLPNLSNATSLKKLHLGWCKSLVEIPASIGVATNLEEMNLSFCESMVKLPYTIGNLNKLQKFYMVGCLNLKVFPVNLNCVSKLSVGDSILKRFHETTCWSHLRKLNMSFFNRKVFPPVLGNIKDSDLSSTNIEEVPPSNQNISPKVLPTNINLESLTRLDLRGCKRMKTLPEISTSIEYLDLSGTSIEELPSSIQNLSRLTKLIINFGNLKILPTNINLGSLSTLDLSYCTRLKTFPEISTSIEYLNLSGTAIKEVTSSIWSWSRLLELKLEGCESLKVLQPILDCSKQFPRLLKLHLNRCKNLVSLPQLPDSLSILNAVDCESLERIQGSFQNQQIHLNFANCSVLSQEAREVIEISDFKDVILPGKEVPAYFEHQAKGDLLRVNLDQRFKMTSKRGCLALFLRFRACLMLPQYNINYGNKTGYCRVLCIQNEHVIGSGLCDFRLPVYSYGYGLLTEHLNFWESSIYLNIPETDVNHMELEFQFKNKANIEIQGCGVRLKNTGVYDDHGLVEYRNIMIRETYTQRQREEEAKSGFRTIDMAKCMMKSTETT